MDPSSSTGTSHDLVAKLVDKGEVGDGEEEKEIKLGGIF